MTYPPKGPLAVSLITVAGWTMGRALSSPPHPPAPRLMRRTVAHACVAYDWEVAEPSSHLAIRPTGAELQRVQGVLRMAIAAADR
jgi:hypothetical protein